ncbi:monovalent cation/H+ antiporter subunit D [uncultured Brevundimonas sp.]|uniref:monovalent cation/H+ antiporter subunit D n=1 Tax=uncultured Brevundimonas sp. TaxID=213418 RepID=UPI002616EBCD|nr:monovalent cation/H+ antiporter subunit D [uncultured Brevundimonas sp.]
MTPSFLEHLIILPIILPLIAAAFMLLLKEQRYKAKATLSLGVCAAMLVVALLLLREASVGGSGGGDTARIYALGNWAAPFGIVLVADRLSTLMLALIAVVGAAGLIFALARWDRAGPRFHALYLLLMMGVSGAVLTGDLFNLFVFFEVMLAASYGLLLHGSGEKRVRAGLGYVAINLTASLFFLIGVALIYGTVGALNMADLSARVAYIAPENRPLFEAGCAILGVAFLIKAAAWPLGLWLPGAYSAASAPVAAVFTLLSKVGVYVLLRMSMLMFHPESGDSAGFAQSALLVLGLATVIFGGAGAIAAQRLERAVGYAVMASSGTVLALVGLGKAEVLGGALFYMVASTMAAGALFLIAEILTRGEDRAAEGTEAFFDDEYTDPFEADDVEEVGRVMPRSLALLGGFFVLAALVVASMPPLAGFIGKIGIFVGLLSGDGANQPYSWWVIGILTFSSFATLLALVRFGMDGFWKRDEDSTLVVRSPEFVAIGLLIGCCLWLTVAGGPALAFTQHTAEWLVRPQDYVAAVLKGRL